MAYGVNHVNVTYVSLDFAASVVLGSVILIDPLSPFQITVTGHYGCGGVSTAIASPSPDLEASIADWIQPIRDLYATSTRPEIVELRTANANNQNVAAPANGDPGMFYR